MAKFCPWSGTFAFNDCTPVAIAMGTLDARFQFFGKRGTTVATRDTLKVPIVIGGVAVAVRAAERMTVDIDLTTSLDNESLIGFCAAAARRRNPQCE